MENLFASMPIFSHRIWPSYVPDSCWTGVLMPEHSLEENPGQSEAVSCLIRSHKQQKTKRETNDVESPTSRFDHREQDWGVFTNECVGKGMTIQLAMPSIIQLVLSIIHPENTPNKF